jgi:hypothetical protein
VDIPTKFNIHASLSFQIMAPSDFPAPWTSFKRHLSFYDLDGDGVIHLGESLRANLSLGLDFPVALLAAIGLQTYYGNTRYFFAGPLNGIDISKITPTQERTMLENMDFTYRPVGSGFDRRALSQGSGAKSFIDKAHVMGLWALTANKDGLVSVDSVKRIQEGTILWEVQRRRKDRSDVLPLLRGGPIIVSGHSLFVDYFFGVKVYQPDYTDKKNK